MIEAYLVTTEDNPFSPFTQFDEWYNFDVEKGYNTCAYLARIAVTSDEMSEQDRTESINRAVNEICMFNLTGNYKRVKRTDYEKQ